MNDMFLWAALILGIVGVLGSRVGPKRLSSAIPGLGWLGLLAGFGCIAAGLVEGLRPAIGTAFFAGLAIVPGGDRVARRDAVAGASAVVLVAAAVGLIAIPSGEVMTSGHLVLVAGSTAALVATIAGLVGATSARSSSSGAAAALAAAGAVIGASLVGFLRSSLPQSTYSVPLRTAEGAPIFWSLPGVEGLSEGLRLTATLDIPSMPWIVGAIVTAAVIAAVLELFERKKLALVAWIAVGVSCIAALAVMHSASSEARLPGTQRYEDTTRQVLADAQANEALVARAAFTGDGEIVIARRDVAPEFFGFGLSLLIVLLLVSRRVGPFAREGDDDATRLAARDLSVRAVSFGWLAVLAAGLIQLGYFGVAWIGSASEWMGLGALFIATGLVIGSFSDTRSPSLRMLRDIAPGLAAAAILCVVGLAWSFGTPFFLSVNAF